MEPAENLVRTLKILELLSNKKNGKTALDIGCGDGRHVQYLDRHGFQTHATDVGKEALNLSLQRDYENNPEFHLLPLSTVANDKIKNNFFDLIVCWETIHWFGGRSVILKQLKELKKLLQREGTVIFTLVKEDDFRLLGSTPVEDHLFQLDIKERQGCLMYMEDRDGYMDLIGEAGFTVNYLGWYSHGRSNNYHSGELDFGDQGSFSMYVFACQAVDDPGLR